MSKEERLVFPENGKRNPEYHQQLLEIEKANVCPFCPEHLATYKKKPVLKKGKHWLLTEVDKPYEGAEFQYMFITKKHITDIEKLPLMAWVELLTLVIGIIRDKKMAFSIILRGGGPNNGSTVAHLHPQIVFADKNSVCLTRV